MTDDMPDPRPLQYHLNQAREEVSETLQQAYIDGFVTDEELDERLDLANQARSIEDLQRLTRDLPSPSRELITAESSTEMSTPGASQELITTGAREMIPSPPRQDRTTLRAILSGIERGPGWNIPEIVEVQIILGGVELDLRESPLPRGGVTLFRFSVLLGGIEITLPPGVAIENEVTTIAGGVSIKGKNDNHEILHTIRLEGIILFGGIEIKIKKTKKEGGGILGFLTSN